MKFSGYIPQGMWLDEEKSHGHLGGLTTTPLEQEDGLVKYGGTEKWEAIRSVFLNILQGRVDTTFLLVFNIPSNNMSKFALSNLHTDCPSIILIVSF